ncbi:MAG: hypothetical protein GWN48_05020, partial [Actinobacteria bacterium]|nr:hypothetical protein [Actinomycetota bacterium]
MTNTTTIAVNLQLAFVTSGTFTRCITFEAFDCTGMTSSGEIERTVTFVDGFATTAIKVDCGIDWDCLTAQDKLHTLRERVDIDLTDGMLSAS